MRITHKIKMDLRYHNGLETIYAVQNDANTRAIELNLYAGCAPWMIPDGVTAAVGYQKSDRTAGLYDKLPDGTAALTIYKNTITAILAPQVMTVAGNVTAVIALTDSDGNQLNTFPIRICVTGNPAAGQIGSDNYFNVNNAIIGDLEQLDTKDKSSLVAAINEIVARASGSSGAGAQIDVKATVGQTIVVKAVDENGKPTEWEAVDRTHWADGGMVEILPEVTLAVFEEDDMGAYALLNTNRALIAGETYTVNWNGVEYVCTAKNFEVGDIGTNIGLGDIGRATGGTSTGEPFVLVYAPEVYAGLGADGVIMIADGSTEVTISIYQNGETIHKLDNKYLDLDWLPVAKDTELAAEQTLTPDNIDREINGQFSSWFISTDASAWCVAGESVCVIFDGVRYECTINYIQYDGYTFGNHGLFDFSRPNTGEPFLAAVTSPDKGYTVHCRTGTHTIAICKTERDKMPEEYLPESVESVIIRSGTAGSTKKFKLTVDDSGTITATEVT